VSGFLLDTNVLSEPTKPKPNAGLVDWLRATSDDVVFVSTISLGEIRKGIDRLSVSRKRATLEVFLHDVKERFSRRTLSIDIPVAERWGSLVASLETSGTRLSVVDSLLAATALEHNLTIVSRDADYYSVANVSRLNPFT
jgi:predicted nucleic acid-binding protein